MSLKQFGGKAEDWVELYKNSPQWNGKKFQNKKQIKFDFSFQELPKFLYKQFFDKKERTPSQPLEIIAFDKEKFLTGDETKCIWFGHSAILLRINGLTIFIDPMMGSDASPIAPFRTNRFSKNTLEILKEIPTIDLVLFTHDHYDHLDLDSVEVIKNKCDNYFVALGVERHLVSWGINKSKIKSFDWWDSAVFNNLNLTFTPTQHASGRGIKDQSKCLWGGWAIENGNEKIYFSGDGGYNTHFKEIGEKLGPFNFGFMECGQYNKNWHDIHMYPEESVQAAIDAKVKKVMPVHWAGFALAQHSWTEPVELFSKSAELKNLDTTYPKLGQIIELNDEAKQPKWWE